MTKTDLIAAIAENTSLTKTQASEALNATLEAIVNSVASGDSVVIPGFGTFEKTSQGRKNRTQSADRRDNHHRSNRRSGVQGR
jgi:DNA-binding protein HU-beta